MFGTNNGIGGSLIMCLQELHKSHTMDDDCLIIKDMAQKELTAQEIVERLIDEQKISGKEAVILLNAINKPAEVRIEKKYTPYIPDTTPWLQQHLNLVPTKCYEPGGTCIDPHMDCINCPKFHNNGTYTASTREIPNPVEPTMKEENNNGC